MTRILFAAMILLYATAGLVTSVRAGAYGFGAATTGGAGGGTCIWTDEASLRDCATGDAPMVATAQGSPNIVIQRTIRVGSNKTIQGPATLASTQDIFKVDSSSNVIISGIAFSTLPGGINTSGKPCPDPTLPKDIIADDLLGCADPIVIVARLHDIANIWLDHNSFTLCGDKCVMISANTGPLSAPNILPETGMIPTVDKITISYSTFTNSFYSILVGVNGSEQVPQIPGRERVTVYKNTFDHVYRRSPRAANGAWIDVVRNTVRAWNTQDNCKLTGVAGFGSGSNNQSQLLARGNTYDAGDATLPENCRHALSATTSEQGGLGVSDVGYIKSVRNTFLNGALDLNSHPELVFRPPY